VRIAVQGTLQSVTWTPAANFEIDDGSGAPIPNGRYVLPPGVSGVVMFLRRLSGTSVTVPLTLTGSFGTWRTFVGGGPSAW
jgi:hypothetical protein